MSTSACVTVSGSTPCILAYTVPQRTKLVSCFPRFLFRSSISPPITTDLRPGASETLSWIDPIHLITYHRVLRFYRDGTVLSVLSTEHPSTLVPKVNRQLKEKGTQSGFWELTEEGGVLLTDLNPPGVLRAKYTFGKRLSCLFLVPFAVLPVPSLIFSHPSLLTWHSTIRDAAGTQVDDPRTLESTRHAELLLDSARYGRVSTDTLVQSEGKAHLLLSGLFGIQS